MTCRILIVGDDAKALGAVIAGLGLTSISMMQSFRDLASSMPTAIEFATSLPAAGSAPKFGSDRPYLKKKKGRS